MPDHYEDLSDVSVDCEEDAISEPTTSTETRLHPAQDTGPQHPLLLLPPPPQQATLPLKPELTSENAPRRGTGSGNQSNNAAPTPKPRIWSISAIIGLEEKDSSDVDVGSGGAQIRSACGDRDAADNDSGHESSARASSSGQYSPVSPVSSRSPQSQC